MDQDDMDSLGEVVDSSGGQASQDSSDMDDLHSTSASDEVDHANSSLEDEESSDEDYEEEEDEEYEEDVLQSYAAGRLSCADVVRAARERRGPASHFMWEPLSSLSAPPYTRDYCSTRRQFLFEILPEEKMFELLQALVEDDPDFPLKQHRRCGCFLHVALDSKSRLRDASNVSSRVLLLLAVKGTERVRGGNQDFNPLCAACYVPNIELEVIDHLLQLDPDAIDRPDPNEKNMLLYIALQSNGDNTPVLTRLLEARPDSLFSESDWRGTPINVALQNASVSPQLASFMETLINRIPACVSKFSSYTLFSSESTPLYWACQRFHEYPDLIRAVIRVHPAALGILAWVSGVPLLPFEFGAQNQRPYTAMVEEETLHLVLAFVELGFEGTFFKPDGRPRERGLERHVRDTVAAYLPSLRTNEGKHPCSGFEVAKAIKGLGNVNNFCRSLLNCRTVQDRLTERGDPRWAKTLEDMCRMNRQGRSNPSEAHQYNLLESVNDNLDCIYLQVRQIGIHILPWTLTPSSTRRKRSHDELN